MAGKFCGEMNSFVLVYELIVMVEIGVSADVAL